MPSTSKIWICREHSRRNFLATTVGSTMSVNVACVYSGTRPALRKNWLLSQRGGQKTRSPSAKSWSSAGETNLPRSA
jgi:hypothetical protein